MKSVVKLFTSVTCPNCPSAKKEITELKEERNDFELIIFETTTKKGAMEAQKENIQSVPTYIIQGEGYANKIGLVGSQGHKTLNKYIDVSLGKIKLEEKKSFLQKLFG